MKTKIYLLGIFALVTLAIAEPRTWVLKTAETVTGDYVSSGTTTLVIKTDGTNCFIKLSDLSADDQAYVAEIKINGEAGQPIVPIDGLFGIKLGEQLPRSCTNSESLFGKPDEWGFQTISRILPPQTNSEFKSNSYEVTLTPINHLVCAIEARNDDDPGYYIFDGVRDALRRRYGKEDKDKSVHITDINPDIESAYWSINHRSLDLVHNSYGSFYYCTLRCQDDSLAWHPAHATDTKGL